MVPWRLTDFNSWKPTLYTYTFQAQKFFSKASRIFQFHFLTGIDKVHFITTRMYASFSVRVQIVCVQDLWTDPSKNQRVLGRKCDFFVVGKTHCNQTCLKVWSSKDDTNKLVRRRYHKDILISANDHSCWRPVEKHSRNNRNSRVTHYGDTHNVFVFVATLISRVHLRDRHFQRRFTT